LTFLDFLIYNVIKILYYVMNRSISNNYVLKRAVVWCKTVLYYYELA